MDDKVIYEEGALADLVDALDWHRRKASEAVADRLEAAVLNTIEEICQAPGRWRVTYPPHVRTAYVARFPYLIHYTIQGGYVVVLAIAHARRRPGYWRGRR